MLNPHVEALLRERDAYERRGLAERVSSVDAELARLGHTRGRDTSEPAVEKAVNSPPETRRDVKSRQQPHQKRKGH